MNLLLRGNNLRSPLVTRLISCGRKTSYFRPLRKPSPTKRKLASLVPTSSTRRYRVQICAFKVNMSRLKKLADKKLILTSGSATSIRSTQDIHRSTSWGVRTSRAAPFSMSAAIASGVTSRSSSTSLRSLMLRTMQRRARVLPALTTCFRRSTSRVP